MIEGVFECEFCSENAVRIQRVRQSVDRKKQEMEGLKRVVGGLRDSKAEYEGNVVAMRSENEAMERSKEVVAEEMKEIEIGIFRVIVLK